MEGKAVEEGGERRRVTGSIEDWDKEMEKAKEEEEEERKEEHKEKEEGEREGDEDEDEDKAETVVRQGVIVQEHLSPVSAISIVAVVLQKWR